MNLPADNAVSCSVDVTPTEVDAGGSVTLKVAANCAPDLELPGARVSIRDAEGAEIAGAALTEGKPGAYSAEPIVVAAPIALGEQHWRAVVTSTEDDETTEEASADASFIVRAHATRMNVWEVPSAVSAGTKFNFKVGVKCSAGCDLAGREVSLVDHNGKTAASGILGAELWPGTTALHYVEFSAKAPRKVGDHQWEVRVAASDEGLPHALGSAALRLKVMPAAEHQVTIAAIDRDRQTPIQGATVVMHPYRARTGEDGLARIKAAKGPYTILVSASKYLPVETSVTLEADVETRAELSVEPPASSLDDRY